MHLAKINNEPGEFSRIFPRPSTPAVRRKIENFFRQEAEGCRDLFEYLEAVFRRFFPFLTKFGGGRDLINAGGVREGNAFSEGYLRDMWIFSFFFL